MDLTIVIALTVLLLLLSGQPSLCRQRRRANRHCREGEDNLASRENKANVVMTGTVRELYGYIPTSNRQRYMGEVEVKRVMKGQKIINGLPGKMSHHHRKLIIVEGLGDRKICNSNVYKYDTRIFLLQNIGNGHLKLNSSVLRMTLRNIDHADAVVNDEPYKPNTPPKPEPCERHYCAYGATCINNFKLNKAECKCIESCNRGFDPVCGTDDVTYTSTCHLKLASCSQQKRIGIKHRGRCREQDAARADPCASVKCKHGAQCKPSGDGSTTECRCTEKCHHKIEDIEVCGTDGVEYKNNCDMNRAACLSKKKITVKFQGKCDPCKGFICSVHEFCQLESDRRPVCKCATGCPGEYKPVCASDGVTYSNLCFMTIEACMKQQKRLKVVHEGQCNSVRKNPCNSKQCKPNQECRIDSKGNAICICTDNCAAVMRPVCGSDGNTYDNECQLRRKSCLRNSDVRVEFPGPCAHDDPCQNLECQHGGYCLVKYNRAECKCPVCTNAFNPVCGYDGITYENKCKVQAENCARQQNILIKHRGECDNCANNKCEFYSICEARFEGGYKCVCPTSCVQVDAKVCGNDGVTYQNECHLRIASCKRQEHINIATHGPCDKCENVMCKYSAKCENGRCVCPQICPAMIDPVCGTDGVTYDNECELLRSACANSENEIVHKGTCDDDSFGSGSGDGAERPFNTCEQSEYGCCSDGITSAAGTDAAGCPNMCKCNKLGSIRDNCHPVSGQCTCKPGVGGLQCDRCEVEYWAMHKIVDGNSGCTPCNCNEQGSIRSDCEQMTGRCICKSGIRGMKCNRCDDGILVTSAGCSRDKTPRSLNRSKKNRRKSRRNWHKTG